MAITFNIHKSRCDEYKKGKLIGYEIPYIIETLKNEGSLIARIYAKALIADNYNGEAKYYRYEEGNKSKSDYAYLKKDKAICELIDLCREYNVDNPDNKIKYGYFKTKLDPDNMRCIFITIPRLNKTGKALCFHTQTMIPDVPVLTERKAPSTVFTNKTVISEGIISVFGELLPKKEDKCAVKEKKKVKYKPKLESEPLILKNTPVIKNYNKEEKTENKPEQQNPVKHNRTTNITSGMTQVEKFAERFNIFKKK